jgi:ribonuclease HI
LEEVHIYTDGGSRGNPGPAASAFMALIIRDGKEKILRKMARRIGRATNNQAEYRALIMGLEWALSRGFSKLFIHSDSELMVKQVSGVYAVKSPRVKDLHGRVMDLLANTDFKIKHHPREEEHISICDSLVNNVLDELKR